MLIFGEFYNFGQVAKLNYAFIFTSHKVIFINHSNLPISSKIPLTAYVSSIIYPIKFWLLNSTKMIDLKIVI